MISELKKKLHSSINKYGINSKKVYELSIKLDEEISNYYKNIKLFQDNYKNSMEEFNKYKQKYGKEPSNIEWNKLAKNKNLLSSESIKYINNKINM